MSTNKPIVFASNLVIEVTRRCNMSCEHCLRGNAQIRDIDLITINKIAKLIKPASVAFTGGEPSLNISAIQYYFDAAERYGTFPDSFYVVTNGKENQEELATTLLRAYPKCNEPEICGVAVSSDIFHENIDRRHTIFNGLSFYDPTAHVFSKNETEPKWVINEGRAVQTGWGVRNGITLKRDFNDIVESAYDDGSVYIDDTLYVNAKGYIISDCDASYDNADENYICHINDLPLNVQKYISAQNITVQNSQTSYDIPVNKTITDRHISDAEQCLIDNGIEDDEAQTLLQALGYILLDAELYPEK